MASPKMADLYVMVGSDEIVSDSNKKLKLSNDTVEASYAGSTWTAKDYGKQSLEVSGEAFPVWSGSGSGGATLTYAWYRYLVVSKLTQIAVDADVQTPVAGYAGDMIVGDIEEGADDPEFLTFGYSLENAGEMTYV